MSDAVDQCLALMHAISYDSDLTHPVDCWRHLLLSNRGFVEFWNTEACEKAATLNGKNLLGRPIRIDWTD